MRRSRFWGWRRASAGSACPPQFAVFNNDIVIGAAVVMYLIEFFADKIPYVDTLWDIVHTAIRPFGGALIAVDDAG